MAIPEGNVTATLLGHPRAHLGTRLGDCMGAQPHPRTLVRPSPDVHLGDNPRNLVDNQEELFAHLVRVVRYFTTLPFQLGLKAGASRAGLFLLFAFIRHIYCDTINS